MEDESKKETFFSVEESLLDMINFIKKYVITFVHSIFKPGVLINLVYASQQPVPANAGKNIKSAAARRYAGAFLYLTLSVIITFCFYRTKVFNIVNQLTQGVKQKILSSVDYLIEVSLLRHLIACGLAVFAIWAVTRMVAWVYKKTTDNAALFYCIPPLVYYFLGTMILVYIGFDYLAAWLELRQKSITVDTVNVLWTMIYCLWIGGHIFKYLSGHQRSKGRPGGWHTTMATVIIAGMMVMMPFVIQDLFKGSFEYLGHLKYKSNISITGVHYDNRIEATVDHRGNRVVFSGKILLTNNGEDMVHLLSDTLRMAIVGASKKDIFSGSLVIRLQDTVTTGALPVIPGKASLLCDYTWETDREVYNRLSQEEPVSAPWIMADVDYTPKTVKERKRPILMNFCLPERSQ